MKRLYCVVIALFFAILLIPVITFNWEEDVASEIDNRMLAENPFIHETGDLTEGIEAFVSDRIGFRDEMITGYTLLMDKAFGELVHPSYQYGKDGYIFPATVFRTQYGDFHQAFVDMVVQIRDYCQDRDIPFLFVFDPIKNAVLMDELPEGMLYDRAWVDELFAQLDANGVPYVDNTQTMLEKAQEGEAVFNQKYNANHWNDLGAFYGVNAIAQALQTQFPGIHINEMEEYEISQRLNTSLLVSRFPIHEYEPVFSLLDNTCLKNLTEDYTDEVVRSESFQYFLYIVNEQRREEGAPKTLVFQGSYMNSMGYKFLQNSLGEYIAVHDYQNVLDFEYYFNLFQPECVVFEVAEYTFLDRYFNYQRMAAFQLNPTLSTFEAYETQVNWLAEDQIEIEPGEAVTVITLKALPENADYAYLTLNDTTYDLRKTADDGEAIYTLSVGADAWDDGDMVISLVDTAEGVIRQFLLS